MTSPDPHATDPARRPTGAIPAHWTVPAEVSASAVDRPLRSFADHKQGGAGKIVLGLVVVLLGAAAGAVATGALDLSALGIDLGSGGSDPSTPVAVTGPKGPADPRAPTSAVEGQQGAKADPDKPDPDEAPLMAEPLIPRADNPTLVAPAEAEQPDDEPEVAATPAVVPLDELPVRKKVKGLIKKGERYVRAGKYKSAAKVLERAAQLDPNYPQAQRSLGIARARLGDFDGAREAYTRYLELDPEAEDAADVRRILGQ